MADGDDESSGKMREDRIGMRSLNLSTIEAYQKALDEGMETCTSLRIMVVGHYGAGKTTLTKKLLEMPLDDIQSTDGIEINVHKCQVSSKGVWQINMSTDTELEYMARLADVAKGIEKMGSFFSGESEEQAMLPISDETLSYKFVKAYKNPSLLGDNNKTINIWDFGGQWIYYATHQLFHSPDAIYLLVLNLSLSLDDIIVDTEYTQTSSRKDVRSFCKFWMHSIHSFVGTTNGKPPVILIGTHMDNLDDNPKKNKDIADRYFISVRDIFNETPLTRKHFQFEDFLINNLTTEDELRKLRNYIVNIADENAKEVPAKWIHLENSLSKMKYEKHVTFDCVEKLGFDNNIRDKAEILAFLEFHNSQGTFIYFDESVLRDCIVLNPQWIIDALKCIITSEIFCRKMPNLYELWDDLMKKAILRSKLINDVWKNDGTNDFMNHEVTLIKFMEKFGIIAKAKKFDEITNSVQELDFFVVPSLLQDRSTDNDVLAFISGKRSTTTCLVFSFENDSISRTLYHRTTAYALGRWAPIEYGDKYLLFEDIGVYRLNITHAGIIEVTVQSIDIKVVCLIQQDVDCEQSDQLRRFIAMVLNHELGRMSSRESQYKVEFGCGSTKGKKRVLQLEDIENNAALPCPEMKHRHGDIDTKKVIQQWYPQKASSPAVSIIKVYDSQMSRIVTEKQIHGIANAIGCGWQQLASQLGIRLATCEQIKMNYPYSSLLQIAIMLTTWKQANGNDALLGTLLRAMDTLTGVTIEWDLIKNVLDKFKD